MSDDTHISIPVPPQTAAAWQYRYDQSGASHCAPAEARRRRAGTAAATDPASARADRVARATESAVRSSSAERRRRGT